MELFSKLDFFMMTGIDVYFKTHFLCFIHNQCGYQKVQSEFYTFYFTLIS